MRRHRLAAFVALGACIAVGCSAIVSYDGYGDGVRDDGGASADDATTTDGNGGGADGETTTDSSADGTTTDGANDAGGDAADASDGDADAAPKKYALVVLGGERYVDAGLSVSMNTVEIAPINSDGTLGAFAVTTPLQANEDEIGAAAYQSSIFVSDDTQAAAAYVLPDGGLSAWANIPQLGRNSPKLATIGSNLYYATGTDLSTAVYRTSIIGKQAISGWTLTTALPADAGRDDSEMVAIGSTLVITGGNAGVSSSDMNTYLTAQVDGTGAVGAWTSGLMPSPFDHGRTVTVRDYVIVLGGSFTGPSSRTTLYAQVAANGTVGAWTNGGLTPSGRERSGFAAHGDFVYLLGGDDGAVDTATVIYAGVTNGQPGVWNTTATMNVPRRNSKAVVVEMP